MPSSPVVLAPISLQSPPPPRSRRNSALALWLGFMTSLPTAYTPLETLLLFQALRAEGVTSLSIFNRISEQLKHIPLVHEDPSYDPGRLSPDALRELYLRLLKDEVKRDLEREVEKDAAAQNGDRSPGSRKRKAPSPSLPTVQEASQHKHLIPQLVARLYARYRENAVRQIREQEQRYDALAREIDAVGTVKGELKDPNAAITSITPRQTTNIQGQTTKLADGSDSNGSRTPVDGGYGQSVLKVGNDDKLPSESQLANGVVAPARTSSGTPLTQGSEMNAQSPSFGALQGSHGVTHPHPAPASGYHYSPATTVQPSPYASHHGHLSPNTIGSPQLQQTFARPSPSPLPANPSRASPNLTGPPQPRAVPPLPHEPLGPHHQFQQQQPHHRQGVLPGGSQVSDRAHTGQAYVHIPHRSGKPSQKYSPPGAPYHPQPHQQSGQYANTPTPGGGYQLAPFSLGPNQARGNPPAQHISSQQAGSGAQQYAPSPAQQRPQHRQHYAPSAPATVQRPTAPNNPALMSRILSALATPPRQSRAPVWKSEHRPSQLRGGTPLPQPIFEPLSPVESRAELPARTTRATRKHGPETVEHPVEAETDQKTTKRGTRTKRERSPHSVISSAPDESTRRTRSQSVSTTAGLHTTADDRPGSRGDVKAEPSTPAASVDDPDAARETSATPLGARMTRKRRGTLSSQVQPPAKRSKRQQTPSARADTVSESGHTPPPRPATITAYRNFHKLSSTIMNDINSHKHASYFSNMVRDKDAPGYSEIIKRPQHLKSIRAAITAGTRAVNAATSSLDSPTAGDGSATVELERSADLMPPKAIVNGAQLEKEVLRTLANAVMFNPGDDGMVRDTREMYEDVDAQIRHWRGAEREVGEPSSATAEDAEEGKASKRRKG